MDFASRRVRLAFLCPSSSLPALPPQSTAWAVAAASSLVFLLSPARLSTWQPEDFYHLDLIRIPPLLKPFAGFLYILYKKEEKRKFLACRVSSSLNWPCQRFSGLISLLPQDLCICCPFFLKQAPRRFFTAQSLVPFRSSLMAVIPKGLLRCLS